VWSEYGLLYEGVFNMKMNESAKLNFALEHVAHLEDYINDESYPSLIEPLQTIKTELENREKSLQKIRRVIL